MADKVMPMQTTLNKTAQTESLSVIRSVSTEWIGTLARAEGQRRQIEQAMRQLNAQGVSVASLSEASGLPPDRVRRIVESDELDLSV